MTNKPQNPPKNMIIHAIVGVSGRDWSEELFPLTEIGYMLINEHSLISCLRWNEDKLRNLNFGQLNDLYGMLRRKEYTRVNIYLHKIENLVMQRG